MPWLICPYVVRTAYECSQKNTSIALCVPPHPEYSISFVQLLLGGTKMAVGFYEAFVKIWQNCWVEWEKNGPTKTFLTDFLNEVSIYGFISTNDVLLTLSLGVFFTILRYLLTVAVFKVGVSLNNCCRIFSNRPWNIWSCIAVVCMQCFISKRARFGITLVAIVVT